jgi:thymidylate synthase
MNNLDYQYKNLLSDILENGTKKGDRTGTGTISVFGRQIRHKMSEGFPILTTKRMAWKQITTELIWFLRGDTNIKYLVDNNCHIWDGDAYKKYTNNCKANSSEWNEWMKEHEDGSFSMYTMEEFIDKLKTDPKFCEKWGELGPVYGKQWRKWDTKKKISIRDGSYPNGEYKWKIEYEGIDQISNLIRDLNNNPDSRRLMVNAWNVGEVLDMTLPPCHYTFQCYTRELSDKERIDLYYKKIHARQEDMSLPVLRQTVDFHKIPTRALSLKWIQRSVDTFLGLPFNITSYGLLLELLAKEVNMLPDELIGDLGDTHIYLNHMDQANEQIGRDIRELPKLNIVMSEGQKFDLLGDFNPENFQLEGYDPHPAIKAPLSN